MKKIKFGFFNFKNLTTIEEKDYEFNMGDIQKKNADCEIKVIKVRNLLWLIIIADIFQGFIEEMTNSNATNPIFGLDHGFLRITILYLGSVKI